MRRINPTSVLLLATVLLLGIAGCNRAAHPQPLQGSNTTAPTPAASGKAVDSAIRSGEKTANGEEIYRMEGGGIKFVLPKSWTALPDENRIALASEDNELRITIMVPENPDYDGVVNSLSEELGQYIQNAKPAGAASQTKLNGMPALTEHGIGDMDGTSVIWKIDVLEAKRPIIILSYTTLGEVDEAHNADYSKFIDSILPLS
jgi:hypothetical protein